MYGSKWKGNGGWRGVLVRIVIIYPYQHIEGSVQNGVAQA